MPTFNPNVLYLDSLGNSTRILTLILSISKTNNNQLQNPLNISTSENPKYANEGNHNHNSVATPSTHTFPGPMHKPNTTLNTSPL